MTICFPLQLHIKDKKRKQNYSRKHQPAEPEEAATDMDGEVLWPQ